VIDGFIVVCVSHNPDNTAISFQVFSPSLLRNPSTDPLQMIQNIKHEVRFVDLLFHHLAGKPLATAPAAGTANIPADGSTVPKRHSAVML